MKVEEIKRRLNELSNNAHDRYIETDSQYWWGKLGAYEAALEIVVEEATKNDETNGN